MAVMPYATWISETKRGVFTPRSKKLEEIDKSLLNYERGGKTRPLLVALRKALDDWITFKGQNWKTSTRNRNGTVERLQREINALLGPSVLPTGSGVKRPQLRAPAPVRPQGNSLSSQALVQRYAQAVKDAVHTPWTTLDADTRATRMHRALADLFPLMNNMPAPGLNLVDDLGGDAGQFTFTSWKLSVASGPFGADDQPSRDEFIDAAKTIYHEGRHCEQWFHMARYAASGGRLTAAEIARALGIPQAIAANALAKKMDARDPMFLQTKAWFQSVYDRSGREITLTALGLKQIGDPGLLAGMRANNHQRYAGGLPEESDAWGTEALLDTAYVWP